MSVVIVNIDATRFSLDGIPYFKNFLPVVSGSKVRILNTYSNFELLPLTEFSEFTVDTNSYASAALLQAALLPVLYTRSSLAGVTVEGEITNVTLSGANVLTFTLADTSVINIDLSALDQAQGLSDHIADMANPHGVTKAQVGLSNVDNTSDADKPISTATQTALNNKLDKGNTIVTLSSPGDKTGVWCIGSGIAGIAGGGVFIGLGNTATPTTAAHFDEFLT